MTCHSGSEVDPVTLCVGELPKQTCDISYASRLYFRQLIPNKTEEIFLFCFSATIFWRMLLNRSEELFASKAFCKSLLQINLANFDTSFTLEGGSRHHSTFTYMWQTVIQ